MKYQIWQALLVYLDDLAVPGLNASVKDEINAKYNKMNNLLQV